MENKELNNKIKRLLSLSDKILDKFEILASLSYRNKENSSQYLDHFDELKDYINQETIIVNNLSLDNLEKIFNLLPEYDDNSDAYNRLHIYIDDKISEYLIKNNSDEIYEYNEEDIEEDVIDDTLNDAAVEEDNDIISKYALPEEDLEKYAGYVIDSIAIIVLKRMYERINNTYADNKNDSKYKKRLLKELNSFKYFVLSIDRNLELIGINYKFDLTKIPLFESLDIDKSKICHNSSLEIIERMYNTREIDYEPTQIAEVLFNYMCLEEYMKYLDNESFDKLIQLCDELDSKGHSYYGDKTKEKLLKRK